jgi:hypothetical protein
MSKLTEYRVVKWLAKHRQAFFELWAAAAVVVCVLHPTDQDRAVIGGIAVLLLLEQRHLLRAIRRREDPEATMEGTLQDWVCCMCRKPIEGERRCLHGDDDPVCSSCWLEANR